MSGCCCFWGLSFTEAVTGKGSGPTRPGSGGMDSVKVLKSSLSGMERETGTGYGRNHQRCS